MKNFCYLPLLAALCSCAGNGPEPGPAGDVPGAGLGHGMIVLGEQLEDPYTVANMEEALASVYPTKAGRIALDPTDLYVRFLPKDEAQYDALLALGLVLVDHPVDYRIVREGDWYHDPSVAEDDITWQYAVVPAGFVFPEDVRYELLDECFIADHAPSTKADGIDWAEVEREAFRLTGNADMLIPATRADAAASPSGRITIVDPAHSSEPEGVKGVMVNCNCFVKFGQCYTDADGRYEMKRTFSSEPRYRLVFRNKKGFCIGFNLILLPASVSTMGTGPASGMDLEVSADSDRKLFTRAVVNNAGYDFFESCNSTGGSMKTPPANLRIWLLHAMRSSSAVMLRQGAMVESGLIGDFLGEYASLVEMFLPDITLGVKDLTDYSEIYSLAIHEFAHASHFMQCGKSFWDNYINYILRSFVTSGFVTYGVGTEKDHGYCEVGEMWAYYVETMFFRDRYGDRSRIFGSSFWFTPQTLVFLDERGLNRYKIFAALTSDIIDKDIFQNKLLALYPELKSVINRAFGRYK